MSASQVRDAFASIFKDISTITRRTGQGVAEQELALEDLRHINKEFLSGFQGTLLQVCGKMQN